MLKKPYKQPRSFSYSREIAIALLVKFLLLIGIWWLFFAGKKQLIDEVAIAEKIFGEPHSVYIIQEKPGGSK